MSIVEAPWRALRNAARWKGQAHQSTTGVASTSCTHGLLSRWMPGTIASTTTGTVSTAATSARRLRASSGATWWSRWLSWWSGCGGRCDLDDLGAVAGGPHRAEQLVDGDRRGVAHGGLLGGEVDHGVDAVEPAQLLLDPGRARGTGHAGDGEVDLVHGAPPSSGRRAVVWVISAPHQARDGGGRLGDLGRGGLVALAGGVDDAVLDVLLEQADAHGLQGPRQPH